MLDTILKIAPGLFKTAFDWHKTQTAEGKKGVFTWPIVAACVVGIVILTAFVTYSVAVLTASNEKPAALTSAPVLVENGKVDFGGNDALLVFTGNFIRNGKAARVYLQAEYNGKKPMVQIWKRDSFVKDEGISVKLITPIKEDQPNGPFRTGTSDYGFPNTNDFWIMLTERFKAQVIVYDEADNPQYFSFLLVPRIDNGAIQAFDHERRMWMNRQFRNKNPDGTQAEPTTPPPTLPEITRNNFILITEPMIRMN